MSPRHPNSSMDPGFQLQSQRRWYLLATAVTVQHDAVNYPNSWVTNEALSPDYYASGSFPGNPVFVFDLGTEVIVDNIVLWQYSNNGGSSDASPNRVGNHTRLFELRFNTEAETASALRGRQNSAARCNLYPSRAATYRPAAGLRHRGSHRPLCPDDDHR
ncbi:MAG: hypothetical protein R3F11_14110 [Verrucomicrobiales bacterium]